MNPVLVLKDNAPPDAEIWPWSNYGGLLLWARNSKKAASIAFDIADALKSLFAVFQGYAVQWPFLPLRVPEEMAKRGRIRTAELEAGVPMHMPYARSYFYELMDPRTEVDRAVQVPERTMATIFFHLPTVFKEPIVFDAIHFYENALSEYTFLGDDITYVLMHPDLGPRSTAERVRMEDAVLNSFRCIEALVGEPGEERRFNERLRAVGIDPNEPVGFRGQAEVCISQKIRWLQGVRDVACAHGRRRRPNPLTFLEVMEAQHLAGEMAASVLLHFTSACGRGEGSAGERRYLLQQIHGKENLRRARRMLGDLAPEKVVAEPGGFSKLEEAISKQE